MSEATIHEPLSRSRPRRNRSCSPFNVISRHHSGRRGGHSGVRFTKGLAATTNLTHTNPWGLWIGFDVMSGVALAAGGFVTSTAVYIFGMKEYKPIVRPAILTGFLGYFLVVAGAAGRPRAAMAPALPVHQAAGPTSPLFEVALCVALYLTVLFIESHAGGLRVAGPETWRRKLVGQHDHRPDHLRSDAVHHAPVDARRHVHGDAHQAASPCGTHRTSRCSSSSRRWLPVLRWSSSKGAISHRAFHHQVQITDEQFRQHQHRARQGGGGGPGHVFRHQGCRPGPRGRVAPSRHRLGPLVPAWRSSVSCCCRACCSLLRIASGG